MPLSVVLLAWPPQGTWGHLHRWGRCRVQSRPRNMLRLPDINVLQATSDKLKATSNKLHKQRAHHSAWELVKISSPWDQQSSSWAPGPVPRGQDGQVVSDKNKYQYIGDFSFLPYTWDIGCKSCVCPKKYRSSIPLSSIYLYLKSGKVLDDKVIDGDIELDRYRIVNTRKKSLFLWTWHFFKLYSIGSMSKWGTSNGSRGGMPKSGMPENSQSGKTKKQVVKPPVGIWVLRSSRMAAMYSSTAGSLNALPCPRAKRERRANTILGEVQVGLLIFLKTIQCKRTN